MTFYNVFITLIAWCWIIILVWMIWDDIKQDDRETKERLDRIARHNDELARQALRDQINKRGQL